MKRRIRFLAALLAVLLLAGCAPAAPESEAEPEEFRWQVAWANWSAGALMDGCLNAKTMMISSVQHLPIWKVGSVRELEQFRARYAGELTLDQGLDGAPSFSGVTEGCDDAFFEKNALLLVYIEASSGSYRFDVDRVACEGGKLCVHAVQTNQPEVVNAMMAGWLIAVEAPLTLLDGVTEYDADLNNVM